MEEKIKGHQVLIKICCIIAAFILWLYIFNVQNPTIERKIVVPVNIINEDVLAQSKLVQIGEKEFNISLLVKGSASDVYSIKSADFQLQSDLSSYSMKKGENNIPVSVKKSPDNIHIVNNDNLWVKLQLDELKQKNISIRVVLQGKSKEGYYALEPILKTEQAEISGAEDVVSKVKSVVAKYDLKSAGKDINTSMLLQAQDISGNIVKDVTINPSSVNVTIPVGKIKTVPISIKFQNNIEDASKLITTAEPDKIDIAGEESVIRNINELDTEAIDLSKIQNEDTLEVKLIVPQGIKLVNNNGVVKLKINSAELNNTNKTSQKEMNLNIQVKNLNDSYTAQLSSSSVSVVISGSESVINSLTENGVSCYVDASSFTEGEQTANVVVSLPEGVSLVSQDPQNIKLQISKKAVEEQNVNNNE
ncbi:YbbR-like domain-containing protein [Clostridium sp. WILCCON 0269]|uniref:YbbR-like domain-containing protein n=1 Tax=Candidatus Clostridium eludens TaxID=3381663 RepID=A0ABW8SK05_9CLOT